MIKKLKKLWSKSSPIGKTIYSYLAIFLILYLIYFFLGIWSGITTVKHDPNVDYYCFYGDAEGACTFPQLVINSLTIVPLWILIFFPIYMILYQPYGIFYVYDFSLPSLITFLPFIFYLSFPFSLYFSIKKNKIKDTKKKVLKIALIVIMLLIFGNMLFRSIVFYRPYYILSYIGREKCNYFNQTGYDFNNISIIINDQKCKYKENSTTLYFTLSFDTKKDTKILGYSILYLEINGKKGAKHDRFVDPSIYRVIHINKTKDLPLFIELNTSDIKDGLVITNSGINVRTLREWNWANK